MTDWNEVVTAWAKWVNGEGLGVQFRRDGYEEWDTWLMKDILDKDMYPQWRVKKLPAFARMYISSGIVQIAVKAEKEDVVELCYPAQKWLGDWQRFREDK